MFSKVSYEVQLERGGRWMTESGGEDEAVAVSTANKLLKTREDANASRVMKLTTSVSGNKRESQIYIKTRAELGDAPLSLSGNPENTPVCQSVEECYGLPARMAINRLLKMFLDKYQIGATELLHSRSYLRKFDDASALIGAAFHQVGTAQARTAGQPTAQRIATLMEFYKSVHDKAKKFTDMRLSLPDLLIGEIDTTYFALGRNDAANAQYDFHSLVTYEFQTGMYVAREQKLGIVVGWFGSTDERDLRGWLDEWFADYLCFPEIIDGLLGQQFNFFEFLLRLVEVTDGQKQFTKTQDSVVLQPIRGGLAAGILPQTQAVLLDRLAREIKSEKPLDKRDPENEEGLLRDLEKALRNANGTLLGGRPIEEAMAARKLRERKRKLRAMGLDDVADNLG